MVANACHPPTSLPLGRLEQEKGEFEASLATLGDYLKRRRGKLLEVQRLSSMENEVGYGTILSSTLILQASLIF